MVVANLKTDKPKLAWDSIRDQKMLSNKAPNSESHH